MKNRKQTLTSLAAASMVLTQAGQMSVFAKEEPMKDLSEKEEVGVEKSQKELLEEQIKNTLDRVNEAKKEFEMAQETYETYNKNDYILAVSNRELAEKNYLSAKDDAQEAIVSSLEKQIQELEVNQAALKEANTKKKDLESKLDDANKELLQAQNDLVLKQKEYESLLANTSQEEIEQRVNELKTQLESATVAYQEATNKVSELSSAKEEVEVKVLGLQSALENAKVELTDAKSDALNAQNEYDVANADYNEKLEIYNGASDPELKAEYEKQVVEAENALEVAQNNLQVALSVQQSKEDAVLSAEANVAAVENEIRDLEVQIGAKENELLNLNESIASAEKELNAAKDQLTKAIETKQGMEEVLKNVQVALDDAKREVEEQQFNVDKAQLDMDAQQKIVNQLRMDKEQVSQKIALGSKGFFEAYGYTNALKVLEQNSKYTQIGDENDATSLENFKKAISMVRTGNALRTSDDNFKGLDPLKVNAEMFAVSQVQVNQMAKTEYGHTKLYRVSENAAVEYEDPYVGWYTEEKAVYDYLQQKGWDINDIRDSQGNYIDLDKANEIVEALNFPDIRWVQVGHYTNMLNSKYNVTGTAWIEGKTSNGYSRNSNQVFYRLDPASLLTIDEFESQFNEYYDSLMNADGAYEDANVVLNGLKNELYAQNALLTEKQNKQSSMEVNKQDAENKVGMAQNEVDRLSKVVRDKQKNLDDLCMDDASLNVVNELNRLKALKSNKESLDLVHAQQEVESVKQESAEAGVDVNNKEALVKNAQMELNKRNRILEEVDKGLETAYTNLEISKNVLKEKESALDVANTVLSKKESSVLSKENEVGYVSESLKGISRDLDVADGVAERKKDEMDTINNNYEASLSVQNRLNSTSDSIVELNTIIQELESVIPEISNNRVSNDLVVKNMNNRVAELESLKLEIEEVKSEFDSFVAGHPVGAYALHSDLVKSLCEKMDVMKESYRSYEEAIKVFEEADALNADNVKALDVASQKYVLAQLDLEKANKDLSDYLEEMKGVEETEDKKSVNTGAQTAFGLYALGGVLGFAGVAVSGKRARKED